MNRRSLVLGLAAGIAFGEADVLGLHDRNADTVPVLEECQPLAQDARSQARKTLSGDQRLKKVEAAAVDISETGEGASIYHHEFDSMLGCFAAQNDGRRSEYEPCYRPLFINEASRDEEFIDNLWSDLFYEEGLSGFFEGAECQPADEDMLKRLYEPRYRRGHPGKKQEIILTSDFFDRISHIRLCELADNTRFLIGFIGPGHLPQEFTINLEELNKRKYPLPAVVEILDDKN